jgi:predicted DNA-binding protein
METMTLTINLPEEVGAALKDKARISGKNVAEYVESMISAQIKRLTFRELFAEVREDVNISDEELGEVIKTGIFESRRASREK